MVLFLLLSLVVEFGAGRITYLAGEKRVFLAQKAWIRTGETYLKADSILFDEAHALLFAWGHTLLVIGEDTLTGDSLSYNTRTKQGVAFHGRTHVEKGWLTGNELYKLSDEVLFVRGGDYTTCDLDTPHYHFHAGRIKVIRDNMAIVSPLVLYIRDIPILGVPFWFFPIAKGRRSGFLTPRFGYNSQDGRFIRNLSYYLVLNNYADVTFTLQLLEKRGITGAAEFLYNVYRRFSGNLNLTLSQDFIRESLRWSLVGSHMHTFPWNASLRGEANLVSDRAYIQDYSEDKTEWLQTELYSFLSYSQRWRYASLTAAVDDRNDLARNRRITTLPRLSLSLYTLTLGPLQVRQSLSFSRVRTALQDTLGRDSLSLESRGSWNLGLSLQGNLLRYLRVTPSLSVQTGFRREGEPRWGMRLRTVPSARIGLSTVLYAYSLFGLGPFEKFRNTLTPSVSGQFSYTPPVSPGGEGRTTRSVNYALGSTLEGKMKGRVLTLLRLSLSLSQDLERLSKGEGSLSGLSGSADLLPGTRYQVRTSFGYDLYKRRLTSLNLVTGGSLSLSPPPDTGRKDTLAPRPSPFAVHFTYSYNRTLTGTTQRLQFSVAGNLTQHWRLRYSAAWDISKGELVDQSLTLDRDLHCWAATFRWQRFGGSYTYDFKIWIKALPDISFKRSLFEAILPR